jgi:hypothetical protein
MKFGVALVAVLVFCSYGASAQNPGASPTTSSTPIAPSAGSSPAAGAANPATGTTPPTVSHSQKHQKHKPVKLKKQKPHKHHKPKAHKIKVHHYPAGAPLQGGVTHKHVHKPLSSSQQSQLQKLENAINNPSQNPANTSKIGTPSNSLPPVSP